MAHWSENSQPLELQYHDGTTLETDLQAATADNDIYLFRFPGDRTDADAAGTSSLYEAMAAFASRLPEHAVVCVLTTPPEAARLLPCLETALKYQLWIAVKTVPGPSAPTKSRLPKRHAALLVLTRYRGVLRHTKTRIAYTYCPACGKTTKDYGGKKHTYHEYGTLMADVWRDMECDLNGDISPILSRLCDLFGMPPYQRLRVFDLRNRPEWMTTGMGLAGEAAQSSEGTNPDSTPPLQSRLINADCLEALRSLPDNSVDFCFADPPYNLQKTYDRWDDALESVEYFRWCDLWLSELARVLKPGRTLAVINIPQWAVRHYQHLGTLLSYQNWIAWEALSFPVRMIMPAHYAILCFSKGEPRPLPGLAAPDKHLLDLPALSPLQEFYCLRGHCVAQRNRIGHQDRGTLTDLWYDIHRLKHNSRRVDHPCQLPPMLMHRLIAAFTEPGEMVLDCFNGAGTTTLVAQQTGRRYIGIELSPQYHQLATERHEQLRDGMDPFAKRENVPGAKNSRVERLPRQQYAVSKKTLQMDVKRIAHELGRLPTREEVIARSRYPIEFYDSYFISWGEVCAAARTTGMSEQPRQGKADPQMSLVLEQRSTRYRAGTQKERMERGSDE